MEYDLNDYSFLFELKEILADYGLETKGKKDVLIRRLTLHAVQSEKEVSQLLTKPPASKPPKKPPESVISAEEALRRLNQALGSDDESASEDESSKEPQAAISEDDTKFKVVFAEGFSKKQVQDDFAADERLRSVVASPLTPADVATPAFRQYLERAVSVRAEFVKDEGNALSGYVQYRCASYEEAVDLAAELKTTQSQLVVRHLTAGDVVEPDPRPLRTLLVSGLPQSATTHQIRSLFAPDVACIICRDSANESKGTAYLCFPSMELAEEACEKYKTEDLILDGQRLSLTLLCWRVDAAGGHAEDKKQMKKKRKDVTFADMLSVAKRSELDLVLRDAQRAYGADPTPELNDKIRRFQQKLSYDQIIKDGLGMPTNPRARPKFLSTDDRFHCQEMVKKMERARKKQPEPKKQELDTKISDIRRHLKSDTVAKRQRGKWGFADTQRAYDDYFTPSHRNSREVDRAYATLGLLTDITSRMGYPHYEQPDYYEQYRPGSAHFTDAPRQRPTQGRGRMVADYEHDGYGDGAWDYRAAGPDYGYSYSSHGYAGYRSFEDDARPGYRSGYGRGKALFGDRQAWNYM